MIACARSVLGAVAAGAALVVPALPELAEDGLQCTWTPERHVVGRGGDGTAPRAPTAGEPAPVVDIMIVYTPTARSAVGGTAAMEGRWATTSSCKFRGTLLYRANSMLNVPLPCVIDRSSLA